MQLPIELLVIIVVVFIAVAWAIWFRLTTWLNKKKYDEKRDKSKGGEDKRRAELAEEAARGKPTFEAGQSAITNTEDTVPRPSEPQGRELLQTATSDSNIEPERVNGKTEPNMAEVSSPGIRVGKLKLGFTNPFKRRK